MKVNVNNPGKHLGGWNPFRKDRSQEKLRITADNGPDQRVSVRGLLGNRLAEGERIAAGFIRSKVEVVGGDRGCDLLTSNPVGEYT
jgi:hypothetical protein